MRTRRHTESPGLFRTPAGRRFLRDMALVAVVALVGWIASALWVSPAPLIAEEERVVPRVLELPVEEARAALAARGFRARQSGERTHPSAPRGTVIWQDPPPDVVLGAGRTVQFVVSAGRPVIPVPDVIGLDLEQARRIVQAAGLRVGEVDSVITTGSDPRVVLATRPQVGSGRPWGGVVGLVVSRLSPTPIGPRRGIDVAPDPDPYASDVARESLGGTTP